MGGDGGSIPGRADLVRTKKRPEQADRHMERVARWLHCAISQQKLQKPIMACELGRLKSDAVSVVTVRASRELYLETIHVFQLLYNKESILEFLLDRTISENAQHVRSLKDVKELNLTENPAYKGPTDDKGDGYSDNQASAYICPVTGLEMSGRYKFCFLWSCGCALSEKAIKEVKSAVCHKCGKPMVPNDEVILNGGEEDVAQNRQRMDERRARAKAEKKAKKAQKRKVDTSQTEEVAQRTDGGLSDATGIGQSKATKKIAFTPSTSSASGPTPHAASKGPKKPVQDQRPEFDPKKSQVYKSLFLSKEDKKNSAHWVTYNPYYSMSGP